MTNLVEMLRLAEQAAEDIYFAKIDRELIANLHRAAPTTTPRSTPPARCGGATTGQADSAKEKPETNLNH